MKSSMTMSSKQRQIDGSQSDARHGYIKDLFLTTGTGTTAKNRHPLEEGAPFLFNYLKRMDSSLRGIDA